MIKSYFRSLFLFFVLCVVGMGFMYGQSTTWYALVSGNWNDPQIWTLDPAAAIYSNPDNVYPQPSDNVVIRTGRTITMNANDFKASTLTVDGRLELKTTSGHQFDHIRGSGRIIMESNNFPSGDASHFTSAQRGKGTVVFQGNSYALNTELSLYNVEVDMNVGQTLDIANDLTISGNLTIISGTLRINSTTLVNIDVYGDLRMDTGTFFSVSNNTPNPVHWLNIHGSLHNSGTIQFSNSDQYDAATNGAVRVKFTGTSNEVLVANGTTNFYRLFLDKGNDQTYRLDVSANNPENFKLYGPISGNDGIMDDDGPEGWERLALVLYNGTLKLGDNIKISQLGADRTSSVEYHNPQEFHIPSNAALWIDGAEVSTHEEGGGWRGITVFGKLKISEGTFTNPPGTGGITYYSNEGNSGTLEITGGKIYTTQLKDDGDGQFNYIQTGGELHINALSDSNDSSAAFALPKEDHTFNMSGGEIIISIANNTSINGIDIGVAQGHYNVTGGTIEIKTPTINSDNQSEFHIKSTAPFYNLIISKSSNTGTQTVNLVNDLKVLNDLTVAEGTKLDAAGHSLWIGSEFDVVGDFVHSNGELRMFGSDNGQIKGIGLQLHHLTIDKTTSDNFVTLANGNIWMTGNLMVRRGDLDLGDKELSLGGNLTIEKGNILSSGTGKVVLNGTSGDQILFSRYRKDYSFGVIELANKIKLNSHSLISSLSFSGDHIVDLDIYNLEIEEAKYTSTDWSGSRMFLTAGNSSDGGLTLPVSLNENYSNDTQVQYYPVGTEAGFTPMEVQARNNLSATGKITVIPVSDYHPTISDKTYALNYFWRVSHEGLDDVTNNLRYIFENYEDIDVPNYSTGIIISKAPEGIVFYNNEWSEHGSNVKYSNKYLRFPYGATLSKDFSFGVLEGAFWGIIVTLDPPRTLYSRESGSYDNRYTWSTVSHTGSELGRGDSPRAIDYCIIHSDHEVTISANNAQASQVEINGTLIVNEGTSGHNIDVITGGGRLVYNNNNFLNADHTEFCNNASAILEFSGVNYSLPNLIYEYPTLKLTGGGTKTAAAVDLKINKDLIIEGPTFNISDASNGDIAVNGKLEINNGSLVLPRNNKRIIDLYGEFLMTGGDFNIATGNSSVEHEINLYGSFTQNGGSINLNNTSDNYAKAKLRFTGDKDLLIVNTRNKANSLFYKLEIDMLNLEKEVRFTGGFSLDGPANEPTKPLHLVSGTATLLNSNIDLTLSSGSYDFIIPAEAALVVSSKAKVRVSGNDTGIWLDGLLKVDNGAQVLINEGTNNYIEYSSSGNAEIWIGNTDNSSPQTTFEVGSQIRRAVNTDAGILSFTQDKAATNIVIGSKDAPVSSRGVFEILNEGSSFSQNESGSYVTIARGQDGSSSEALIFAPDNINISEGTGFIIGGNDAPEDNEVGLRLMHPIKNLIIELGNNSTAKLRTVGATIEEELKISSGIFNANGLDLELAGNLVNDGGAFEPAYNLTSFTGVNKQLISGNLTLYDMDMEKQAASVLSFEDDTELTVNNNLNLHSGIVNTGANNLYVKGNLLVEEGVITQSKDDSDGIILNGESSQLIGGGGEIARLTIANPSGVVLPTQSGGLVFTNQLKLEEGIFDIGRNLLVIGKDARIVPGIDGFSKHAMIQTNLSFTDAGVQRGLPKIVNDPIAYIIPIGSMGKYTPVTMNVNSNAGSNGAIRVKAANEPHISIPANDWGRVLQYYWTLDAHGVEGFSADINMKAVAGDVYGDATEYITARLLNASEGFWNRYEKDSFDEGESLLMFEFMDTDDAGINGDYTAGEDAVMPEKVETFVTIKDGNWNDEDIWEVKGGGTVPGGGPRGAIVDIKHKVDMPGNGYAAYLTLLDEGGVLNTGNTFGHRLGKVSGKGRLVTLRESLPAGEYDQFFSSQGGTLEYSGTGNYDILGEIPSVNNLVLSGSGTRRWPNLTVTLNGDLEISGAVLSNENSNNIDLKGDFIYDDGNVDMKTGQVSFTGASRQYVKGNSNLTGSNALHNMTINNTAGLCLDNILEVTKDVIISKGNIISLNNSPLYMSNALGNITINNAAGYVGTALRKKMANYSTWDFPVGKDGRRGDFSLNSVQSSGVWEVEYFNSTPPKRHQNGNIAYISNNEYWEVTAPAANAYASVTLRWDDASGVNPEEFDVVSLDADAGVSEEWTLLIKHNVDEIKKLVTTNSLAHNLRRYYSFGLNIVPELNDYTWIGASSSDWFDTDNWYGKKLPSAATPALITTLDVNPVPYWPVMSDNNASIAQTNNLTIEEGGSLTLNPGSRLTVNGDLSIADEGSLIILNKTGEGGMASLLTHGDVSGKANVNLSLPTDQWFYLGSSIKDATFGNFSPGDQGSGTLVNVYRDRWYSTYTDHVSTPLRVMEGVSVYYHPNGGATKELSYTGVLNNGEISRVYAENRHQLMANPYPSFIDWQDDDGWTRDDFESTIWYRMLVGDAMTFITYNKSVPEGGRLALYPDGSTFGEEEEEAEFALIAPMQSVYVRPTKAGATLTINNAARCHGLATSYLKGSSGRSGDVIRIVSSNEYSRDGAVVYFASGSESGIDGGDSEKYFNEDVRIPEIYTQSEGKALAINGLPPLQGDHVVLPLSVRNGIEGEVTLSFDLSYYYGDHLPYLYDNEKGVNINLVDTNEYKYSATNTGDDHTRFELHFINIPVGLDADNKDVFETGAITISGVKGKALVIIDDSLLNESGSANIEVFTINGQKFSECIVKDKLSYIDLPDMKGVYIVRVVVGEVVKSERVLN